MTTINSRTPHGANSKTRPARKNRLAALAGIAAIAAVGITTACSAGVAPQDMSGATGGVHQTRSVGEVQDNPNGCTPFGGGTNGVTGWRCFYTGTQSTITVPEGMTHMTLAVAGGEGYGGQGPADGGYSVAVGGTWTVTAGQTVALTVGQAATNDGPGDGAASGGHAGGSMAGDGGGASEVELNGAVVAVAGGGGGGGAQGIFDGTDNGGSGGVSTINHGDGHNGSGPSAGKGHSGGNGSELADGSAGGSGSTGGGAGGGGGWGGGSGGGGGGGGAGGAAGGSYVRADAQNPSVAVANAGGDGSIVITWN